MATATQQQKLPQQTITEQTMDAATQRVLDKMLRQTVTWKTPDATEAIELSIDSVRKLFATPTKSGKLPSDRECWLFLQMCKARGLNPYLGDAYLVGYDEGSGAKFNLITAHQALMKRAEASGKKTGMESGVIVQDKKTGEVTETAGDFFLEETHKLVGAWCKVYRSDYEKPVYDRVKLSTYDKGYSRWKADPAGMIVKVAEASVHRLAFPAEVGGLYVSEEMSGEHSFSDERKSTSPKRLSRSTLNDLSDLRSSAEPQDDATPEPEQQQPQAPEKPARKRERAPDGSEIPELFDAAPDAVEGGH